MSAHIKCSVQILIASFNSQKFFETVEAAGDLASSPQMPIYSANWSVVTMGGTATIELCGIIIISGHLFAEFDEPETPLCAAFEEMLPNMVFRHESPLSTLSFLVCHENEIELIAEVCESFGEDPVRIMPDEECPITRWSIQREFYSSRRRMWLNQKLND